jgi:phosphoglucosamine mutase
MPPDENAMSKRLFGTDGIRGRGGEYPLDPSTVETIGSCLAHLLRREGLRGRVLIGYDTRASSAPLGAQVALGLARAGGEAHVAGVLPTPGVAYLVRTLGFDAGVVISASHNPFPDNGIKVFQANGTKLSDLEESRLETMILAAPEAAETAPEPSIEAPLAADYAAHLVAVARAWGDLAGCRIVADLANGAAVGVAAGVFAALGMRARLIGDRPDGQNINLDCGSLHTAALAAAVRAEKADLGLAFDGDADRCLVVDDTGRLLDGDHILYLAALDLRQRGELVHDTVVATVMSNLWLERRLRDEGITLLRTPVGDKYVLEAMEQGGHVLGGEQSGHVIFRRHATTGDGLLTGLLLAGTWRASGRSLSAMVADIVPCPQTLLGVRVRTRADLETHPGIAPVLAGARRELADKGRILVRYSGTEPLVRVMTEGEDASQVRRVAEEVAEAVRVHLG